MVTRDSIYLIGASNVVVCTCLTCYERGDCSWEEALMTAVQVLVQQNDALLRETLHMERVLSPAYLIGEKP